MSNCESDDDLLLEATELRLGLPGTGRRSTNNETKKQSCSSQSHSTKRTSSESGSNSPNNSSDVDSEHSNPPRKAQIVGWPPVRSNRQIMNSSSSSEMISYVKVSMDGAPYLRKIDLRLYKSYHYLVSSLETMFKCTIGSGSGSGSGTDQSEYVATYEDKDGDWMLAGDVPWEMFITSCKRIRVMKASDAKGLGCCI